MLYKETVTDALFETLKSISSLEKLSSFRLVGGTAIALQIGHRRSIDLDLFSNEKVKKQNIAHDLENKFTGIECFISQDGITTRINDLKIDIFDDWMIPFKEEPVIVDRIKIASLKDLAAFKLTALTERREKKDYIDLYFLFQKFGGLTLLKEYHFYNPLLSAKSLLFALEEVIVAQENSSPMPDMIRPVLWEEIKNDMHQAAKEFLFFLNNTKR
jgi:hypothetical protein